MSPQRTQRAQRKTNDKENTGFQELSSLGSSSSSCSVEISGGWRAATEGGPYETPAGRGRPPWRPARHEPFNRATEHEKQKAPGTAVPGAFGLRTTHQRVSMNLLLLSPAHSPSWKHAT